MREELVKRLTDSFGGPLNTLDMELLLRNPDSIVNKAAAGYVTMVAQQEVVARWNNIISMIEELKSDIRSRVEEAVDDFDDDQIAAAVKTSTKSDNNLFEMPDEVLKLQNELKMLQQQYQQTAAKLATSKAAQKTNFDTAVKKLPPDLKAALDPEFLKPLDDKRQAELVESYREKTKSVDTILKMAGSDFPPPERERLMESRTYKFEITKMKVAFGIKDDENLIPSKTSQASKLFMGQLAKDTQAIFEQVEKLKEIDGKIATTAENLVVTVRASVTRIEKISTTSLRTGVDSKAQRDNDKTNEIPTAPPRPEVKSKSQQSKITPFRMKPTPGGKGSSGTGAPAA